MSLPDWMNILKATVLPKSPGGGARLKGLGIVIGVVIAAAAVFVLTRTLKHIDYNEVFAVVRNTNPGLIALAAMLVVTSYVSLTLYDLLALRTIGRPERSVPDRGSRELYQLSDFARSRSGFTGVACYPLSNLFVQRAWRDRCRQHLLSDRTDLLAGQPDRARVQVCSAHPMPSA